MSATAYSLRTQFFTYLFGEDEGWICIATQKPNDKTSFKQTFFHWPEEKDKLGTYINTSAQRLNVWFCVNLLSKAQRRKEFCLPTNLVWADLDTCKPTTIEPEPQCIIESSPGRWQAIWRLDQTVDPHIAEEYSKKIAYKNIQNGADPSGWDLTQLLRVPLTFNFKYTSNDSIPQVSLERALETPIPVEIFEALDVDIPTSEADYGPEIPDPQDLPDPDKVIYKYFPSLSKTTYHTLYYDAPEVGDDWSKLLWRLINICIESGMTAEETFSVALSSACNKYERDNRPIRYLWKDVLKAEKQQSRLNIIAGTYSPLSMPQIIDSSEIADLPPTIIDNYRIWATEATDAVPAYHDLCCFMLLSSLMAAGLYCDVSYGKTIPNIWGLVLGDSTLTRKTTAMRMAMDFVAEIDRDIVLATDGSAEGLLTGLAGRPNKVSVFFKDEVAGFIDSINRKDYLAGMPETMTQLYDVPPFTTRRLRKETISIVSPVFIFFGGGIKDKMYSLINESFILSGFMPRFLIVSGDADLARIRRTGPATKITSVKRDELSNKFFELYNTYSDKTATIEIAGQEIITQQEVEVVLTDEAWARYGDIEDLMVQAAHDSPISMLALPTFERMSRSLLKMAMLLAAARQPPSADNRILCEVEDVVHAANYIQNWGRFSVDLLINSGRNVLQRTIDKILKAIEKNPGVTRSKIMQTQHLSKREMDEVQHTLMDRQQIIVRPEGRGVSLWPI